MSYPASPAPGESGAPGASVCPRHPDRAAYARCQRCGRPACGECQRPATVGFHCVDCAQHAAAARPAVRTIFGGVNKGGPPVVTITIMVICVALEALGYIAPGISSRVTVELIFVPAWGPGQPYRFFTSTLLHGSIWHLAFNMYALWLIGQQLEPLLGRARFFTLYFLSAVGGSVAYLAIEGVDAYGVVGASGGVFGLFGAFAVLMRRLGRDPKPILIVIGINVVLGFVLSNIAWQAHLGGLVIGALVAVVFSRIPVRRRPPAPPAGYPGIPPQAAVATGHGISGATLQWLLCGAIFLAMVAIVVAVYALA